MAHRREIIECQFFSCHKPAVCDINGKRKFCKSHRTTKTYGDHCICEITNCTRPATHGDIGCHPTVCFDHRFAGSKNLQKKICQFGTCGTAGTFKCQTTGKFFCKRHRSKTYTSINRLCRGKNCDIFASYAPPGTKSPIFCESHKTLDCIMINGQKCIEYNCNSTAHYKPPGTRAIFCNRHHVPKTYNKKSHCAIQFCNIPASHGLNIENNPTHCFWHALPGQTDFHRHICVWCELPYTLDCLYYVYDSIMCYYCALSIHKLQEIKNRDWLSIQAALYTFSADFTKIYKNMMNSYYSQGFHSWISTFFKNDFYLPANTFFTREMKVFDYFGYYVLKKIDTNGQISIISLIIKIDFKRECDNWTNDHQECVSIVESVNFGKNLPPHNTLFLSINPYSYVHDNVYYDPRWAERIDRVTELISQVWKLNVLSSTSLIYLPVFYTNPGQFTVFYELDNDSWNPNFI